MNPLRKHKLSALWAALFIFSFSALAKSSSAQLIADHEAAVGFHNIPANYFSSVETNYRIFYGHTSHGSQIVTGIDMLGLQPPLMEERSDDLGHEGDTHWVDVTRDWLNSNPQYNVVMWSWCGGVSDNTEEGINTYLNAMNGLEQEFPGVIFVYMTGHLDGSGEYGNLRERNRQIRNYAIQHQKVLFDFEDIESFDPDGNYYPDDSDGCGWCSDWCTNNPDDCPDCGGCAHSHCFNCLLKGRAWWWMMARLDGWDGGGDGEQYSLTVDVENPEGGIISSSPGDISCPALCTGTFAAGTLVTLSAEVTDYNYYFAGWEGGTCSGRGSCTIEMNSNQEVTARFEPALRIQALWNGFLAMTNVLELVNPDVQAKTAAIDLYNINGELAGQQDVFLSGQSQLDVILNDMAGFGADSYGIVEIIYPSGELGGRVSFYRPQAPEDYEFAFALPFLSPLTGESAVSFNTHQPSQNPLEAGDRVAQWLSIVNLDRESTRSFAIERYDQTGAHLFSQTIAVAPFTRLDIEGGHENPGPGRVGLNTINPSDPTAPYLAQLVRYGERNPALGGYAFAFPLSAKRGSSLEQWAPVSSGANGENWLEILNFAGSSTLVDVEIYDNSGQRVYEEDIWVSPFSQQHLHASALLGSGMSGAVRIRPSSPEALIEAQSMFYFRNPQGSIEAMYGSQAKELSGGTQNGSYNLFLGMYNWLRIFNARPTAQQIRLSLSPAGTLDTTITLPPHSGRDLGLHEGSLYGTAPNTLGLITLECSEPILAEVLRIRPGATGGIDFSMPTLVERND